MANYNTVNNSHSGSPYGSGTPYNESSGFITPRAPKKGISNWIKICVPVAVVVIVGAVLGGVLGSRSHNSSSSSNAAAQGSQASASAAVSANKAIGIFATSTNSEFMIPVYPQTVSIPGSFAVVWLMLCL